MAITDTQRTLIAKVGLTADDSVDLIKEVGATLPPEQRKEAATALFGVPPTRVNGLYWLVLGTLCGVLTLCALRLVGVAWFVPSATDDQILGMFTTILSFLIGLFVPSPVRPQ